MQVFKNLNVTQNKVNLLLLLQNSLIIQLNEQVTRIVRQCNSESMENEAVKDNLKDHKV